MTNPNEPAYPVAVRRTENYMDEGGYGRSRIVTVHEGGLTIREYFAALAMQGILAAQIHGMNNMPSKGPFAAIAVDAADSLIAELNKEPPR